MSTQGVVRQWDSDDGWGVIDSGATPGGCWAHFSVVRMSGYKSLEVGQEVELEVEAADQDGYAFRAVRVWTAGAEPEDSSLEEGPSAGHRSELQIAFDPPD